MQTGVISQTTQTNLIIGGIAFLSLAGIVYYAYSQGKKTTTVSPPPYDTKGGDLVIVTGPPTTGQTGGVSNVPGSSVTLSRLAGQIYQDIDGINYFGYHDVSPYQEALSLSNTDYVQLYNIFNNMYQKDLGETLKQAVANEWGSDYSSWGILRNSFVLRYDSLNLP